MRRGAGSARRAPTDAVALGASATGPGVAGRGSPLDGRVAAVDGGSGPARDRNRRRAAAAPNGNPRYGAWTRARIGAAGGTADVHTATAAPHVGYLRSAVSGAGGATTPAGAGSATRQACRSSEAGPRGTASLDGTSAYS